MLRGIPLILPTIMFFGVVLIARPGFAGVPGVSFSYNDPQFVVVEKESRTLANLPDFSAVGLLSINQYRCSGTLIGRVTVLTAKHCVKDFSVENDNWFGFGASADNLDSTYRVSSVKLHWSPFTDLALVELDQAVPDIAPAPIYRSKDEIGKEVTIVGYGLTGTPSNGVVVGTNDIKRAGTNVITNDHWSQPFDAYTPTKNLLVYVLDSPASGKATKSEYAHAQGDSGGPLFVHSEGQWWVAGVATSQPLGKVLGVQFGTSFYASRVSQYVDWIDKRAVPFASLAMIVDVSGSMNDAVTVIDDALAPTRKKKIEIANDATRSLAAMLKHGGAGFSLSTFGNNASTVLAMGAGAEQERRLEVAVTSLSALGGTNIGAGLEQGFIQLRDATGNRCAVLMSDGQNNVGSFDRSVENFIKADIPIYTVGFGEEAGREELSEIATLTKGIFEPAVSRNLPQKFLKVANNCTHTSTVTEVTERLPPGAQLEYDILILDGVSHIGGYATWQGSTLDLVLIDPRGRQIPSAAISAQGGEFTAGLNFFVYSMAQPEPGRWRARFFWSDPPPVPEQINIAFSEQSDVVMSLVGIENEYAVGAPVQIVLRAGEVVDQERVPLKEARMRVRVQKPGSQVVDVIRARSRNLQLLERVVDAATVTVDLHDDGKHGDYHPGDGIFGNVFTDTHEPGVYLIRAEVSGRKSDSSWVQREIAATFQVGPLAANPVTAAAVLEAVDLLSQRQNPVRAIEAVRSDEIRSVPAPLPRPADVAPRSPIPIMQPPPQSGGTLPPQTQPRSSGGPAAAIERLRARD
jgi:hypothetical protein